MRSIFLRSKLLIELTGSIELTGFTGSAGLLAEFINYTVRPMVEIKTSLIDRPYVATNFAL